jgi:hypothetical protein
VRSDVSPSRYTKKTGAEESGEANVTAADGKGVHIMRCGRKEGLEVHHKRRDGGSGLENTEVLCAICHQETETFGLAGTSPPQFDLIVKLKARQRAGDQCECMRIVGCH